MMIKHKDDIGLDLFKKNIKDENDKEIKMKRKK